MPIQSPLTIAAAAYQAGVRDQGALTTAVAIAIAESAGNSDAVGDVTLQNATWGPSYGLWQVRSLKAETGKGTIRDGTQLKNIVFNAKSMFSISSGGTNWSPWTTHRGLRYTAALPVAAAAATATIAAKGAGVVADEATAGVTEPIADAADAISDAANVAREALDTPIKITKWLSEGGTWVRIAHVAAGAALLIAGAAIFAKPLVESTAGGVVKGVVKGALK